MTSLTPILWSKLDGTVDVTLPQIGPAGTVHGVPTFPVGYFGDAAYSNFNSANYITFPLSGLNNSKGTIEFWSERQVSPAVGDYVFWSIGNDTDGIYFEYNVSAGGDHTLKARVRVGGIEVAVCEIPITGNYPRFNPAFGGCPFTHLAVVWDRNGNDIGGGKTLAIFADDRLLASSIITWDDATLSGNLILLNRYDLTFRSCGSIDNIKVHAVCKTDFNDRGVEALCSGDDWEMLGKKGVSAAGLDVEGKIYLFPYTCTRSGYPIKVNLDVYGAASPSKSGYAFAIYDSGRNLLCSTYAQLYSMPCAWHEWVILSPPVELIEGESYYFAVWGGYFLAYSCTNGTRTDWLYKALAWVNFPNWPNPFVPDIEGGSNRGEPCWYAIVNEGDFAVPSLRTPDNLLCEQLQNPINVSDPRPEFSARHRYE